VTNGNRPQTVAKESAGIIKWLGWLGAQDDPAAIKILAVLRGGYQVNPARVKLAIK